MADELSELVDSPEERLDVEYKAWLDLSETKHRAAIARHIAALANFGGGYIVFGINDDGQSCGPAPGGLSIDHDIVAGITRKYLEPPLHCDVRPVKAATGVEHLVIVVPPHGATPVCAKANGPEVNGRVTAIVAGTYYLRKPGPESARIETAAEWRDVVRRCALHDRAAILAAVTAALSGGEAHGTQGRRTDLLARWSEAADRDYLEQLGGTEFVAPVRECRIQLSYRIETEADETLPEAGLIDTLRQVAAEVDQHVQSGWSIFYVFSDAKMRPRWMSDPGADGDEFLEANLITPDRELGFDLWRVSPRGFATVIREFWEDTPQFQLKPRATLNPRIMARTLGELVRHAEAFGARFGSPVRVEFRCEWRGLKGRHLFIPNAIPFMTGRAEVDHVITGGQWPIGALATDLVEIVSKLGGKVARALDWEGFTPQWVAADMKDWTKL